MAVAGLQNGPPPVQDRSAPTITQWEGRQAIAIPGKALRAVYKRVLDGHGHLDLNPSWILSVTEVVYVDSSNRPGARIITEAMVSYSGNSYSITHLKYNSK